MLNVRTIIRPFQVKSLAGSDKKSVYWGNVYDNDDADDELFGGRG